MTISPRPALACPGPGPAPPGLGAPARPHPARNPCRRRAPRPRAPGTSAARPPSAAPPPGSPRTGGRVAPGNREPPAARPGALPAGFLCGAARGRGGSPGAQDRCPRQIPRPRQGRIPVRPGDTSVPPRTPFPPPPRVGRRVGGRVRPRGGFPAPPLPKPGRPPRPHPPASHPPLLPLSQDPDLRESTRFPFPPPEAGFHIPVTCALAEGRSLSPLAPAPGASPGLQGARARLPPPGAVWVGRSVQTSASHLSLSIYICKSVSKVKDVL